MALVRGQKHFVLYDGKTVTLGQLRQQTKIPSSVLYERIILKGMSPEDAVALGVKLQNRKVGYDPTDIATDAEAADPKPKPPPPEERPRDDRWAIEFLPLPL